MAVVLIQDYIFTIVVSTLSGVDQLLSITNSYGISGSSGFLIGAALAAITWYLTIRGRGESARVVFSLLGVFGCLTIVLGIGLVPCQRPWRSRSALYRTGNHTFALARPLYHMLTASMKGIGGAVRPGSHVEWYPVRDQRRLALVKWGKQHMTKA